MALITVWNSSCYSYPFKSLSRLCVTIMHQSHRASASTAASSLLPLSHTFTFTRESLLEAVNIYLPESHRSPSATVSGSSWSWSIRGVRIGGDGGGLPVRLIEVDFKGSSPVCKHRLLCDEAMVASSSAALVGQIHGAFIWPRGLIVMVRQRRVGGGSTQEERSVREGWENC